MTSLTHRARGYMQRNEFLRHVLTLMSGTVVAQAIPLVATLIIGHRFSESQVGLYAAVMAVGSFLIPLAAWRYDMAIVLPESDADARQLLRLATVLNTITSVVLTVAMVFLGGPLARTLHHPEAKHLMLWSGPIVWSWAEVYILRYWANRTKNFRLIASNNVVNSAVSYGGQSAAGFTSWGVPGLLGSTVVGEFVAVGHAWWRIKDQVRSHRDQPARSWRELMREYKKMPLLNLPNQMVDQLRLQGIPFLLGMYLTFASLGQFQMAWNLVQVPSTVINFALGQVFLQRMSRAPRGDMFRLVRASVVRSLAIGVIPFALVYLLAPPVLPLLLSGDHRKWRVAGHVAAALVPWIFLNFVTTPISNAFVVTRRQGTLLAFAVVYAAVPLGLIRWHRHDDLVSIITWVSWSMAALLVVFIGLALLIAWQFDHGTPRPDEVQMATGGATSVDVAAASANAGHGDNGTTTGTDLEEDAAVAAELTVEDPGTEPRSR